MIRRKLPCASFTGRAAQNTELATSNSKPGNNKPSQHSRFRASKYFCSTAVNGTLTGTTRHNCGSAGQRSHYLGLNIDLSCGSPFMEHTVFVLRGCKHKNKPAFIHIKYSCTSMRKWKEWKRKWPSFIPIPAKKPDKTLCISTWITKGCFQVNSCLFSNILE